MVVTDHLIYIQMQKTGCTHIAALLAEMFEGRKIGKHNAPDPELLRSGITFASSIRNPWDWYLSLWTYGVQGKGGLMNRLTRRNFRRATRVALSHPMLGCSRLFHEVTKNVSLWSELYRDSRSIELFRQWLKNLHHPGHALWLGEGYGETAITEFAGFMSYRYMALCCAEPSRLCDAGGITCHEDLLCYERKHCFIDHFIRQECLEEDFCKVVEQTIRPLAGEERDRILNAKKVNTSRRPLQIMDYYDEECIELVRQRDRLIIEKFGYQFPGKGSGEAGVESKK